MDKCIKCLKVAAYISEVIVASSIVIEMIGKIRGRKAASVTAPAPAAAPSTETNPA